MLAVWLRRKLFGVQVREENEATIVEIQKQTELLEGAVNSLTDEVAQVRQNRAEMSLLLDDTLAIMKRRRTNR